MPDGPELFIGLIGAVGTDLRAVRGDGDPSRFNAVSEQLIDADEKRAGDDLGQNVRDTFPEADVFLDATDPGNWPRPSREAVSDLS